MKTRVSLSQFLLEDGNLYAGIYEDSATEDEKDALISLLDKTVVIEHEGRKVKSIKLENKE